MAEAGRALVFADAPEWRETVAAMFAADAPAPQDVLDGVRAAARRVARDLGRRPEVVVALPAAGFPVLTASVADHLAAVGRLDRARPRGARRRRSTCAS